MMNGLSAITSIVVIFALAGGFSSAQALEGSQAISGGQPPRNQRPGNQPTRGNIENYLKHLQQARTEQIKLRLGVSEEKARAVAEKWGELEAPIRKLYMDNSSLWRQMQFILQEASPEREKSRKIKPLMSQYNELRRELYEARKRLYEELPMMGDSPIQQARILFLMEEMERKERDGIMANVERRRGQPPQG